MLVRRDYLCSQGHTFEVVEKNDPPQERQCPQHFGCWAYWKPSVQVQPEFKPFFHEHLSDKGVQIESREQYRRELERRGLYGPYCEPGSKSASTRWTQPTKRCSDPVE